MKQIASLFMATVLSVTSLGQWPSLNAQAETIQTEIGSNVGSETLATAKNGFGALLSKDINAKQPSQVSCNIYNVEMTDNFANVRLDTTTDCRVVVGIYTEVGDDSVKLEATGIGNVAAGETTAWVELPGLAALPEYYLIRAYLIGENDIPLSAEYENAMHTRAMAHLLASDISDYADYEVLNLDDDTSTNFVVFQQDVKTYQSSETENIITQYDLNEGTYTIQNYTGPTEKGSIVSIQHGEDVDIFQIVTAEKNNDLTTIVSDPTLDASEVFAYSKIEMNEQNNDYHYEQPDLSQFGNDVYFISNGSDEPSQGRPSLLEEQEDVGESEPVSFHKKIRVQVGNDKTPINWKDPEIKAGISYDFGFEADVDAEFHYYLAGCFLDIYVKFTADNIKVNGEFAGNAEIKIPLGSAMFFEEHGVEFGVGPYLALKVDGKISVGFEGGKLSYDTTEGFVHQIPTPDCTCSASASVLIGFSIEAKLTKKISAELTVEAGLIAEGQYEEHEGCEFCFDGTLSAQLLVECDILCWDFVSDIRYDISDFYFSSSLLFGLGECPNKYRAENHPEDEINSETGLNQNGITPQQEEMFDFTDKDHTGAYTISLKEQYFEKFQYEITELIMPDTYDSKPIKHISNFADLPNVKTIRFPKDAWELGGFQNTGSGGTLTIPEQITKINNHAFAGCGFTELVLTSPDNICDDCSTFIMENSKIQKLVLPDGLTKIKGFTFNGSTDLREVVWPSTLTFIDYSAFADCPNLNLTLPPNIQYILDGAFQLEKQSSNDDTYVLKLPDSIQGIGGGETGRVFKNRHIKKLIFPNKSVKLGKYACAEMPWLESVDMPSGLDGGVISEGLFMNCEKLKNIKIPEKGCSSIGPYALKNTGIKKLTLPQNISTLNFNALEDDSCDVYCMNPKMKVILDTKASPENYSGLVIHGYKDSTVYELFGNPSGSKYANYPVKFVEIGAEEPSTTTTTAHTTAKIQTTQSATGTEPQYDPPQTITFTDLKPNTVYNFYDLLGDEFTAENLLFLSQGISDSNGNLTIWYRPKSDDTNATKYVRYNDHTETTTTTAAKIVYGDTNLDGLIDVSDAVLLARFIGEDSKANISQQGKANADCNHDNQINGDDCIVILKFIAKLIDKI